MECLWKLLQELNGWMVVCETTGTGIKASPYKTLNELRNITFTTAYVKTANYVETYSTLNWNPNKNGTYKAIGLVNVKGTNNAYGVCYPYNMNGTFEGFIFDAEDSRVSAMKTDRGGYTNIFNKCLFKNAATNCVLFSEQYVTERKKNPPPRDPRRPRTSS